MAVLFYSKKMVKKGYCGNENLALARDRIKVCEIAPFRRANVEETAAR